MRFTVSSKPSTLYSAKVGSYLCLFSFSHSVDQAGSDLTDRSKFICLPSARINGVRHHLAPATF